MSTLKKRIEEAAFKITEDCGSHDEVFRAGTDFALKAVIEMLEERWKLNHEKSLEFDAASECEIIINLLKEEV